MTYGEGSPGDALSRADRLDDAMRVVRDALRRIGVPDCEVQFATVSAGDSHRLAVPLLGPHGWFATLVCSCDHALTPALEREVALLATYLSVWCTVHRIAQRGDDVQLTPRQLEIAELAARGETNAEIAQRLGISVNTVKVRLKQVFERLDVCNRTELAGHPAIRFVSIRERSKDFR